MVFLVSAITFLSCRNVTRSVLNLLPSCAEVLWSDIILWPFGFLLIFYRQSLLSSADLMLISSHLPRSAPFRSYPLTLLLYSWRTLMGTSRPLERIWGTRFQMQLSCLVFIKGHASPLDAVIPCLSRFWWNGRWWWVCKESSDLCHSFLMEIESKHGLELPLWHLTPKPFSARACSVCLVLCFWCLCSSKHHTFGAAGTWSISIPKGGSQQLCGAFLVLPSQPGPSEVALCSWHRWLYSFWDLN